jgi:uncharacterized protein YdbL (DUF1318 family)
MKKRFWVMLVLSLLVIGLLSSCVSAPIKEENNDNTSNTETFDGGLVVNGDFSKDVLGNDVNVTVDGWFKYVADWDGVTAQVTIENSQGKVLMNAGDTRAEWWKVQLAQWIKNVEPGKTYTIKFKAKSSASSPKIFLAVALRSNTNVDDWPTPYLEEEVNLTSEMTEYTYEVNVPAEFDPDSYTIKLAFELGASPEGEYYFDDVSFTEK